MGCCPSRVGNNQILGRYADQYRRNSESKRLESSV